ncbi:CASP-like protein 5C3 isoform X2 [Arabidopsis lyrata subsp. lyrata]|uniref:CASP-like protein 5C3 isoform X2 n=1 Tax=Arabidopsis lyrata subsp. lyrata TaxID=81972 RepID=UPI000A29A3D4|nr:CASP-like protein 5C3 isoform X2 [Arabidopsis lyrata subsp. lyrata]|eukprot:XP_020867825.1 CASP-like protein 5C3 isoform X2 [Arabidopsis lyrata subsp. lyrata]
MVEVPGSVGTTASLSLSYLVTIMSLAIPWNLTLAMVDIYCVILQQPFQKPRILLAVSIGDWVVSVLVLASASSAASVVDILRSNESSCPPTICNRYQFAATLAFLTWFLSLSSSLFNLWLLPSLI